MLFICNIVYINKYDWLIFMFFFIFSLSLSLLQHHHRYSFIILRQLFTLWSWLPARITMYTPTLLYTTEEHGCSLTTFYVRVEQHEPTLLMIKTCNNEVSMQKCLCVCYIVVGSIRSKSILISISSNEFEFQNWDYNEFNSLSIWLIRNNDMFFRLFLFKFQ